ncbi:hypothetical protein INT47_001146 [Mucor saturninus]|uniref:Uncharacterized protein n=1 Tax=Mucor saturninus TaxID=64648 RepID=A0A8H7VCL4_9FUNG|nr:hypothetical protein INT47_001146 [Mucor saturninus]
MPGVQLNNRSDRRVAQRFDAKRQSKREKQLIRRLQMQPRITTPSSDTSVPVEMSLVHQQPAKQSSGQEHGSSFETETDPPVQEQAVFELEEEQKPKILDEEVFDEELADESSVIATPKEELVLETTSSPGSEKDNHAVDNKVNQKLSDKNITAQQEELRSNESTDTVQKASHASKNDTVISDV